MVFNIRVALRCIRMGSIVEFELFGMLLRVYGINAIIR